VNIGEPTTVAARAFLADFDLRRTFSILVGVTLILFLACFNRLTKRSAVRESTVAKIAAVLNSRVPFRFGGLVILGLFLGWALTSLSNSRRISKVVAMQRTLITPKHYTNLLPAAAWVVLERARDGVAAKIELEMKYPHTTGYQTIELGHSASLEEGTRTWGFIDWREDGLHVGRGSNEFFVSREELEAGGR